MTNRDLARTLRSVASALDHGRLGTVATKLIGVKTDLKPFLAEPRDGQDQRFFNMAKAEHEVEGECEFDDDAIVSISEGRGTQVRGAYVQAWMWVENPDFDHEQ